MYGTTNGIAKFLWLARAVAVAAFILLGSVLGPNAVSRADGCDALLNSQMAQCAGLSGVSYRNCKGHAMAVYTQCVTGAHY
jgi:hypothetical protein